MFRGKFLSSMDNIDAVLAVRAQVPEFSGAAREPQDTMAFYALVFDEADVPCGSGRLYIDANSHFRIDRLGVLPDHRGHYLGDLLARMLLYRAQQLNAASVYADVPAAAAPFFARYGFSQLASSGDDPVRMAVASDRIRLEGSCSKAKNGCSGDCANCKGEDGAAQ